MLSPLCNVGEYFIWKTPKAKHANSFHTIMNHSPKVDKLGMQLDFQGVLLLMWGAAVPLIYYGFYCDKKLQIAYWSLVSTSILSLTFKLTAPNQAFSPRSNLFNRDLPTTL